MKTLARLILNLTFNTFQLIISACPYLQGSLLALCRISCISSTRSSNWFSCTPIV